MEPQADAHVTLPEIPVTTPSPFSSFPSPGLCLHPVSPLRTGPESYFHASGHPKQSAMSIRRLCDGSPRLAECFLLFF